MHERLYRFLLLAYPARFRRRFGPEMVEAFRALHERVARKRGPWGLALLWALTGVDALVTAGRERLRSVLEAHRDTGDGTMTTVRFHLGQAFRTLRRSPGYALAFTLTLGLAIGVNSAVFSVVNGVLLEPLPFQDAERILYLKQPAVRAGMPNMTFSFIEIDDYRAASTTVDEFVEFGDWDFSVVNEGEPHRAVGGLVTSNYFDVLGLRAAAGRTLDRDDDRQGAEPVMVLTHEYWTRAFGADPGAVDRTVDLTGVRARIVGVLEPGFHYTGSRRPDFYVNYTTNTHYQGAAMRDSRTHRMTDVFARVAPGVSVEAARQELRSVASGLHGQHPDAYPPSMGFELEAVPWHEELSRRARPIFLLLMGTVGAVLLLACANLTNLTLARLIRTESDLATRGALGARTRDLRLHLTAENVLLALVGSGLGLALAFLSRGGLVAYARRFTVRAGEVGIDGTVLGVTLAVGLTVAVVLAWLPGLPVNPGGRHAASAAFQATRGRRRKHAQRGLVVAQLALSFTLLTGAGLLVQSLLHLYAVDPGFDTGNVLTFEAPGGNYASQQDDADLFHQVLGELRAHPGVREAAVTNWAPLTGQTPMAWKVRVEGESEAVPRPTALKNVSPGYLEALGMRLEAGRFIGPEDDADTDSVIVINRSMADAYFPSEDPVGRRLGLGLGQQTPTWFRVVGVVSDAQEHGLDRVGVHTAYLPADQSWWGPTVVVAVRGDTEAVAGYARDLIRRLDPNRPVDGVRTLEDVRAEDVAPSRLNATLFGAFAVLALLIAAVGVLGVLAFSVSQRVREFGVRMALGASQRSVLRSVLLEGGLLVGGALLVGVGGAFVLGRVVSGLLFAVDPLDPGSLSLAAGVLATVTLGAAAVPALRATRVDPAEALRSE